MSRVRQDRLTVPSAPGKVAPILTRNRRTGVRGQVLHYDIGRGVPCIVIWVSALVIVYPRDRSSGWAGAACWIARPDPIEEER